MIIKSSRSVAIALHQDTSDDVHFVQRSPPGLGAIRQPGSQQRANFVRRCLRLNC
jgi:hypothetical protein